MGKMEVWNEKREEKEVAKGLCLGLECNLQIWRLSETFRSAFEAQNMINQYKMLINCLKTSPRFPNGCSGIKSSNTKSLKSIHRFLHLLPPLPKTSHRPLPW